MLFRSGGGGSGGGVGAQGPKGYRGDAGLAGPPGSGSGSGGSTWQISNGRFSTSYFYYYEPFMGYVGYNYIGGYSTTHVCNDNSQGNPGWNTGYGSIYQTLSVDACEDGIRPR